MYAVRHNKSSYQCW